MSPSSHYIPALDGLRAGSILLVWLSHAWLGHLVPGGLGVTVFFFISGYIITRLMLREYGATGTLDIRAFYVRRFLRLMPALCVFVLIGSIVLACVEGRVPLLDLAAALFYFSNYWTIGGHFMDGTLISPFSITWSLAVEEHYYLVFPWLFVMLAPRGAWLARTVLALIGAVLLWRFALVALNGPDILVSRRLYMGTDTRVDSILYGAIFALLAHARPGLIGRLAGPVPFFVGFSLLLFTLIYRDAFFREVIRYSVQGVALACMFAYLVFGRGVLTRFLSSAPMTYIGRISYSLYLYHWLVFVMVDAWMGGSPLWARMAVMAAGSWTAAHLSWRYVESAGTRLRGMLLG
ncbi:acyltransferase [Pigmentiphaga sp.]|uniref:acyltransferase family protein n=1 Tax=Pigmentiphaga sp. TaxID=1977564 RepID=UPI0025E9FE64|nr:acyltransferase [Pigmentiphaga sp.]